MTDTTSGALPGLRGGSFTVSPAGSRIAFSTRNLIGMTAAGEFQDFRADIQVGAGPADSAIGVTVVMSSVNTKSKMRDRDLQKKKIFNSATRPEMDFSSTGITAAGDAVTITGLLTVRECLGGRPGPPGGGAPAPTPGRLPAGNHPRRITLAGRYTGTTPGGGH